MQQADLFLLFTSRLDAARLPYMVSGSVASMLYGEPRLTNDIDIILDLDFRRAPELSRLFPLNSFYCPPEEVIRVECRRFSRGHFNIIHHDTGHKADVYLPGADALQKWGLAHRRKVDMGSGKALWVAPPEYVILRKLDYYREGRSEKHRLDIRGMLDLQGDALDRQFLAEWIERLGVSTEWADVAGESKAE